MWDDAALPDFQLPANSAARNAGIDLSKSFNINGKIYAALPGMDLGYFKGTYPDLGAINQPGNGDMPDTQTPTVPTGLFASVISSSQIHLNWNVSIDNIGVKGYKIYRSGIRIADVEVTAYHDSELSASTTYTYTVTAYDAAGNESVQSSPVSATTQAPNEPAYVVLKTAVAPMIDGDLSEYAQANSITLSSPTSGNIAAIKALWDSQALYISFEVTDTQLEATETTRDGNIWNEDAVEWFIDTQNNGGGSQTNGAYMLPDDYHGIVNILNAQYDSRGSASGSPSSGWNGTWQSAVKINGTTNNPQDSDRGFSIEIKIPWSELGYPVHPADDTMVAMSFALDDKDGASFSAVMWPNITTAFENASKWQQILLSGKMLPANDTTPPSAPKNVKVTVSDP
jgi:hypothetical protein